MPMYTLASSFLVTRRIAPSIHGHRNIAATMKRVREIGYETVQLSGLGNIAPEELARILDGEGLRAVITHVPVGRLLDDFDALHAAEESACADLPGDRCLGAIADFSALETIGAPLFPRLQHMRLMTDARFGVVVVIGANSYPVSYTHLTLPTIHPG